MESSTPLASKQLCRRGVIAGASTTKLNNQVKCLAKGKTLYSVIKI